MERNNFLGRRRNPPTVSQETLDLVERIKARRLRILLEPQDESYKIKCTGCRFAHGKGDDYLITMHVGVGSVKPSVLECEKYKLALVVRDMEKL
jgi:hypothetical protein